MPLLAVLSLTSSCPSPQCAEDADCGDAAVCAAGTCTRLGPLIHLADAEDPTRSPCADGTSGTLFRDCAMDFGDVDAGTTATRSFIIENPSAEPLVVDSVVFDASTDPAFFVDGAPFGGVVIDPNDGVTVDVAFSPNVGVPVAGALRITSNASTMDDGEDVVIALSAAGVGGVCPPDIEVSPVTCDFGPVAVGATATCDITLRNRNPCEAVAVDAAFSVFTPNPAFSFESFPLPFTVPSSPPKTIRLLASPSAVGTLSGTFTLEFLGNTDTLSVPLLVQGRAAPTCVARVSSVGGVATDDEDPDVAPIEAITLSADRSLPSTPGGEIVAWSWTVLDRPAASPVSLTSPTARETTIVTSGGVDGVPAAGRYSFGLTVTDDLGHESPCAVSFDAAPRSGLFIELSWDELACDLDLHLTRGENEWCGPDDCSVLQPTPNWGGGTLDPRFEATASARESITIDAVADGAYAVGVDVASAGPTCAATLRAFAEGSLQEERLRSLSAGHWLPTRIDVVDGAATFTTLDTVDPLVGLCVSE